MCSKSNLNIVINSFVSEHPRHKWKAIKRVGRNRRLYVRFAGIKRRGSIMEFPAAMGVEDSSKEV